MSELPIFNESELLKLKEVILLTIQEYETNKKQLNTDYPEIVPVCSAQCNTHRLYIWMSIGGLFTLCSFILGLKYTMPLIKLITFKGLTS